MTLLLRPLWLLAASAALLLGGCASPPRSAPPADGGLWSGRLALKVDSNPPQAFSAGFELKGRPEAGELALYTPLGGTLAVLAWTPGSATLRQGNETRSFDSLDALVTQATGTPIPVPALFDWLAGTATPVPGWTADLTQLANGRLNAQRIAPPPAADLRIVLDRP